LGDDGSNRIAALNDGFAVGEGADEVVIGQDVNGLAESGQFAGGDAVRDVLAVGDHCDGFSVLSPLDGVLPGLGLPTGSREVIG
jgi:hypothetical protein